MKNIVTVLMLIIALMSKSFQTSATTFTIDVKNNFFDPSLINAVVGDVLDFEWKEGFHTTTSDEVPAGATTWDAPMNSSNTTFLYTIAVAGHYHYFCTVHGQMMSGTVEVGDATGIFNPETESSISVTSASSHQLSLHFQFSKAEQTNVALYNLAGNKSAQIIDQILPSGDYSQVYEMPSGLTSGVYFLTIETGTLRLTRKVVIQ